MFLLYTALIDEESDKLLFEDLYIKYRTPMVLIARGILQDTMEAEDAVHNAFVGIAKQIKCIPTSDERVIRAYLFTAARNAALNLLPRKHERDRLLDLTEIQVSDDLTSFDALVQQYDQSMLIGIMKKVPLFYREVLMLRYVQEMEIKDIAALLGRTQVAVRKQISRGKRFFIDLCKEEGISIG